MKRQWVFCALFLFVSIVACKQQNGKGGALEKNKEMVEQVVIELNNAIVNADSIQLTDLTSDALTYGHSSGLVQNKEKFINDVVHGPFNFSLIDNLDQSIHFSRGTAIVRHVFEAKATNAGEPVNIRIGNIQVYQQNEEGKWQLLARQAYKL